MYNGHAPTQINSFFKEAIEIKISEIFVQKAALF